MRAATITAHGRPPEVLDRPEPVAGDGELLVAVTAVPLTPLDLLCATGTSYFGPPALPYVPGVQAVGVVRAGPAHLLGSRVWFPTAAGMAPGDGGLAELAVGRADQAVLVEAAVPDTTVAALGLSAVAAWEVLEGRAGLRPGEQVLVLGAGGVVGQVAVQAARLLGARRVVAACRSASARERALACGADAVVDLRSDDDAGVLATRFREACEGGVDVVVDPLAGIPGSAAASALADGGRLVNLGSSAGSALEVDSAAPSQPLGRRSRVHEQRPVRRAPTRGVRDRPRARGGRTAHREPRRRDPRRGGSGVGGGRRGSGRPPGRRDPLTRHAGPPDPGTPTGPHHQWWCGPVGSGVRPHRRSVSWAVSVCPVSGTVTVTV